MSAATEAHRLKPLSPSRVASHGWIVCLAGALAVAGPGQASVTTAVCENPAREPAARRLTVDPAASMEPSLAWNGAGWGVAWSDGHRIWFARLDADGALLGAPVLVGSSAWNARHARLVWTGDGYGVAWEDTRDLRLALDVRFARLDETGEAIGPDIEISSSSCDALFPTLAWTGTEFGIAWEDCRDFDWEIYFARIAADGSSSSPPRRITAAPGNSMLPALVWDGEGYGLAWSDLRQLPDNGGNFEILFNRLDASGEALGPDVRVTTAVGSGFWPALAWNGVDYGLAWHDRRDDPVRIRGRIFVVRLDAAGQPYAPPEPVSDLDQIAGAPSLTWTGEEFGLAWSEIHPVNPPASAIRFARLTSGVGLVGEPLYITQSTGSAWRPALIWTGTSFGVAWDDDREGNREVYFAAVRCDCVDADGDGFDACSECDDASAAIHPGAVDLPGDLLDQDCDGEPRCDPAASWRHRGEQVACVARACAALIQEGRVTPWECPAPGRLVGPRGDRTTGRSPGPRTGRRAP